MNISEVKPTLMSVVVYTVCGFSSSLLAKRKKVVSIPYVSITISNAV